jgi:hypothetical protein
MKLVEEKYGTIEYDASVPCITATFSNFMTSEQFRAFLDKGLQHLIEKKKKHERLLWLADTSKHGVQPEKDTRWVAEEWNPRALKAGINHVAFVLPANVFGGRAIDSYSTVTKEKKDEMVIEIFGDVKTAKDWFRNLKPVSAALK